MRFRFAAATCCFGLIVVAFAFDPTTQECPKFQGSEMSLPSRCISSAFIRQMRSSNPQIHCVKMALRCNLLQSIDQRPTVLTFNVFLEAPEPQLMFERRVQNESITALLSVVQNVRLQICFLPANAHLDYACSLINGQDVEAIWNQYFSFYVDLKMIRRGLMGAKPSCNCCLYEMVFHNQWKLCHRSSLEKGPTEHRFLSQPCLLGGTVSVIFLAIVFYKLFQRLWKVCCLRQAKAAGKR